MSTRSLPANVRCCREAQGEGDRASSKSPRRDGLSSRQSLRTDRRASGAEMDCATGDGRQRQGRRADCTNILYGLMRRIRSSRQLEYACGHNIDFMWLAEGWVIDHDTICKFRRPFKDALKEIQEGCAGVVSPPRHGSRRENLPQRAGARLDKRKIRKHQTVTSSVPAVSQGRTEINLQPARPVGEGGSTATSREWTSWAT